MTFSAYFEIIMKSVCETGYDAFFPSLCTIDGEVVTMKVLDGDLSDEGEEKVAMNWVEEFVREGRTVIVAFRSGQRIVTVLEIVGFDATRKREIKVNPWSAE